MKQTAVEWLIQQLSIDQYPMDIPKILEQAKEMERLQLIDAQSYAISNADMSNNRGYFNCDKWYDETYGSNGSDEQVPELSDDEIQKGFISYYGNRTEIKFRIWNSAIYWYREKIKLINNGTKIKNARCRNKH